MYSRLVALLIALTAAAPAIARSQGELDALADRMGARLTILDNKPADCPHQANGCFRSQLRLTMPSKLPREWVTGDFKIYFGSVSPVIEADSREFSVRLINGDCTFSNLGLARTCGPTKHTRSTFGRRAISSPLI